MPRFSPPAPPPFKVLGALLCLVLAAPSVAAQTPGPSSLIASCINGGTEGGIDVDGGSVGLVVSDALTGETLWPLSSSTTPPPFVITESGSVPDLTLETNVANPATAYLVNRRLYLPSRFYVLSFFPTSQLPSIATPVRIAWSGSGDFGPNEAATPYPFYDPGDQTHSVSGNGNIDSCFKRVGREMWVATEDSQNATGYDGFLNEAETLGNTWTLPYDLYSGGGLVCPGGCNPNPAADLNQFVAYNVGVQPGPDGPYALTPEFKFAVPLTLPASVPPMIWDVPGLKLRFIANAPLTIATPTFSASGVIFEASNPALGWGGVYFQSGSVSTLDGSTVQGVTTAPSLSLVDATVTLKNSTIDGVLGAGQPGIDVTGPNSSLTVQNTTTIEDHDGVGILARGGLTLVKDNSLVTRNGGGGVRSVGSSAEVRLKKARVTDNFGPGAYADYGSLVDVRDDFLSTVSRNEGGLATEYYSQVSAGTCIGRICTHSAHDFSSNTPGGAFYDALAIEGSSVLAEGDYWFFQDVNDLVLVEDASSVILVQPLASAPGLTSGGGGIGTVSAKSGGDAGTTDVRGLTTEALRRFDVRSPEESDGADLERIDLGGADVALLAALQAAADEDERRMAFGAATWMLGRELLPETVSWLEGRAVASQTQRPWALRALTTAYGGSDRLQEARAVAAMLAADYVGTEHESFGLVEGVRLGMEADDTDGAAALLASLEALQLETGAVEAARLFMGLPTSGAVQPRPETADGATTAKAEAGGEARLSLPTPNPSRNGATLALTLPSEAHVRAEVIDLLGRTVLTLADETHSAGRTTLEVARGALVAGTYLVRVSAGGELLPARRFTVVR